MLCPGAEGSAEGPGGEKCNYPVSAESPNTPPAHRRPPSLFFISENRFPDKGQDLKLVQKLPNTDFLGGSVVKNPPANAGDTGSSPGPG